MKRLALWAALLSAASMLLVVTAAWGARTHPFHETASLHLTGRTGAVLIQTGAIHGTFNGRMNARTTIRLNGRSASFTFTVLVPGGSIGGHGNMRTRISGKAVYYHGTGSITGGTGRYRGASGSDLRFTGRSTLSASRSSMTVSGVVRY